MTSGTLRVLGVDPGSRVTGYGVIEATGAELRFVTAGTIRTIRNSARSTADETGALESDMPARLKRLYDGIGEIVDAYAPHVLAIEEVFMSRNPRSALILGQARGAILCASANHQLPVAEYSARLIKQSLVGKGSAEKAQVNHMVRVLLGLTRVPASDAADALACAICHCHNQRFGDKLALSLRHARAGGA